MENSDNVEPSKPLPDTPDITQDKYVKISCNILRVGFIAELSYFLINYVISGIMMLFLPSYYLHDALYCIFAGIVSIILIVYVLWRRIHHRITLIPLIGVGYLLFDEVWTTYLRDLKGFMAFADIAIVSTILLFFALFGAIWMIPHFIIITIARRKQRKEIEKIPSTNHSDGAAKLSMFWALKKTLKEMKKGFKKAPLLHIIVLSLFVGSTFMVVGYESKIFRQNNAITITPKGYQIDFAYWGSIYPEKYTAFQRDEMNEHGITIITYNNPNILSGPAAEKKWVDLVNVWKTNYSNIKIMAVAPGIPGGFAWDGGTVGTIALVKAFLNVSIQNNLTNMIGVNTDQESPQNMPVNETYRNTTRNAEATKLWNEFFTWEKQTYPAGRFEYQTTFGLSSVADVFDGDDDLDIAVRNNVLSVPGWDEYAPMIYEAGGSNERPDLIDADLPHFRLYTKMQLLKDSLTKKGLGNKIGVYLGITNQSFMSADNRHSMNGEYYGKGYEGLVIQAKIAKHFGCKRLTTFILDTVPESGRSMGGVFDSYGDDFMDRYNESLNGPDSTKSFTIAKLYENDLYKDIQKDLWLNWGMSAILSIVFVCLLLIAFKLEKKYNEIQHQK
jgi:hypothetical protein